MTEPEDHELNPSRERRLVHPRGRATHALLAPRRPDRQRAHDPRYLSRPAGDGARRDRGYTLRRDILPGGRLGIRLVCRHWRVDGTLSAPRPGRDAAPVGSASHEHRAPAHLVIEATV